MPANKKTMLVVNNNLAIGGVQTSLINFLKTHENSYDITLFLFYANEEQLKRVPEGVKTVVASDRLRALGTSQKEAEAISISLGLIRGACAVWAKKISNVLPVKYLTGARKSSRTVSGTNNEKPYDIAISYLHGAGPHQLYGGCNEFVLNHIKAKEKICFVHCDYEHYEGNTEYNRKICGKFDKIVCCSEGCKEAFLRVNPSLANKTFVVHNIILNDEIWGTAGKENPYSDPKAFNILTVARLSEEKGIPEAVEAFSEAIDNGMIKGKVVWNIVGNGPLKDKIEGVIKEKGLENVIYLHGAKNNPYPYFKYADALLVPSRHEAAPMIFGEASVFGVPIYSTNTTSAKELVSDKHRGVVCNTLPDLMKKLGEDIHFVSIGCDMKWKYPWNVWDNEQVIKEWRKVLTENGRNH